MKKLLQRGGYALAGLVIMGTSLAPGLLFAQTANDAGNGFRISPVRAEYTIEKGKSETLLISVENPTGGAIIAKPIVNDFVSSDKEDGEPRLILDDNAPSPKNSFKKLIEPIADTELAPRQRKDVKVTVSVPSDANSGGYYGAVRFTPAAAPGAGNVGLSASVGTIFLVRVPGNLTERTDLVQLSAASKSQKNGADVYGAKSFFTSGNVSVLTRLKNNGDIHVKPFGRVQVKSMFGKVVEEFEFNNIEPRANILPDSTRRFTNDLKSKTWFGRYTIEANLGYSQGGGDLISSKATFWYIPALALWAMLIGITAIVGFVYWLIRRKKARKQHKHDVNKQKI